MFVVLIFYFPNAILIKLSLIAGIEHNVVLQIAVKINAIAANGNASGSTVKDATPKPCPALPIAKPRVTGSVIPNPVKIRLPYVPPNIPLNTIALYR